MNWLTNNLEKQLDRWISQWFNNTNTGDLIVVMMTTMMGPKPYAFIWNLGPWTQKWAHMWSGSRAPNPYYGLLWNFSPGPENNMKSYGIDGQSATCIHTKSGPRASKPYEFIWNLSPWSKKHIYSYWVGAKSSKTIWNSHGIWTRSPQTMWTHMESVPEAPNTYECIWTLGPRPQNH